MTLRSANRISKSAFLGWRGFGVAAALMIATWAEAAEPVAPPDDLKPKTYATELQSTVTLRMGDTVTLSGSDFSAKLVGFTDSVCAVPGQNCGAGYSPYPTPDFQYFENGIACEPKNAKDRKCVAKLVHIVSHEAVWDRAKVKVRIIERPKRK